LKLNPSKSNSYCVVKWNNVRWRVSSYGGVSYASIS
jgi:hypothetical protein